MIHTNKPAVFVKVTPLVRTHALLQWYFPSAQPVVPFLGQEYALKLFDVPGSSPLTLNTAGLFKW